MEYQGNEVGSLGRKEMMSFPVINTLGHKVNDNVVVCIFDPLGRQFIKLDGCNFIVL